MFTRGSRRNIQKLFNLSCLTKEGKQVEVKLVFNSYLFSTQTPLQKKDVRKMKRDEEKMALESLKTYSSVSEQDPITQEEYIKILEEREKELKIINNETNIPNQALISALIISLPVIVGGPALAAFAHQNLYDQWIPFLTMSLIKYTGLHIGFLSGIHWGISISLHDMQMNSINSSSQVRNTMILATVPILASYFLVSGLIYTVPMTAATKLSYTGGLMSLYIYNLLMDFWSVRSQSAPKWFFKLKMMINLLSILGTSGLAFLFMNYNEKTLSEKDPFRKYVPSMKEITDISSKKI